MVGMRCTSSSIAKQLYLVVGLRRRMQYLYDTFCPAIFLLEAQLSLAQIWLRMELDNKWSDLFS